MLQHVTPRCKGNAIVWVIEQLKAQADLGQHLGTIHAHTLEYFGYAYRGADAHCLNRLCLLTVRPCHLFI